MKRLALSVTALFAAISVSAFALETDTKDTKLNRNKPVSPVKVSAFAEDTQEWDPNLPGSTETLMAFDQVLRADGEDTMSEALYYPEALEVLTGGCQRAECDIWVNVVKNEQKAYLYLGGRPAGSWLVSTAGHGRKTPDFDGHPTGPFFPGKYSSKTYPGGDYKGLGNMPYAMFYNTRGFALHGTPSINKLGRPDSHGCTRMHPDNALYLNQMVRKAGAVNVYFSISGPKINPAVPMFLSAR